MLASHGHSTAQAFLASRPHKSKGASRYYAGGVRGTRPGRSICANFANRKQHPARQNPRKCCAQADPLNNSPLQGRTKDSGEMIMATNFCGTTLEENFTGVFPFFPHTPIIPFPPPIFLTALWKRGDAEKLDGIRSGQRRCAVPACRSILILSGGRREKHQSPRNLTKLSPPLMSPARGSLGLHRRTDVLDLKVDLAILIKQRHSGHMEIKP